jgi:hypothetical protein
MGSNPIPATNFSPAGAGHFVLNKEVAVPSIAGKIAVVWVPNGSFWLRRSGAFFAPPTL